MSANVTRLGLTGVLMTALVLTMPMVAAGQTAFEVASIRPSAPRTPVSYRYTPTGLFYTGATLGDCILAAWQISGFKLSAPEWIRDARFDIQARAPGVSTKLQLMRMLQTLLAERFALAVRSEPRVTKSLVVTVRSDGPKLTRGDQQGLPDMVGPLTKTVLTNQTMSDLAHSLGRVRPLGAPVIDGTGLQGRYDFVLDLGGFAGGKKQARDVTNDALPVLPADSLGIIGTALKPYGLAVESRTVPIQIVVVDRAERMPTEN